MVRNSQNPELVMADGLMLETVGGLRTNERRYDGILEA